MSHRNARLTVRACLEMVIAVETGLTQAEIARQFRVSRATVQKYVRRFREQGETGLLDRSSRPRSSPRLTPARLVTKICSLRRKRSWGPHRIGWRLKMPHSTVYAVLKRMGISRLGWMHRTTREIVRYEHPSPGDMVHLDVKKLARVPDGGGKRFKPGFTETHSGPDSKRPLGYDYLHVAIDDHSRVVYIEVLPDEKGPTTTGFLERTLAFYSAKGMRVKRILTDNGGNYISHGLRRHGASPLCAAEANTPVPPPNKREGRTVHPNPAARVGILATIRLQPATVKRTPTLHQLLQSTPTTRRYRRGCSSLKTVNNLCGNYI